MNSKKIKLIILFVLLLTVSISRLYLINNNYSNDVVVDDQYFNFDGKRNDIIKAIKFSNYIYFVIFEGSSGSINTTYQYSIKFINNEGLLEEIETVTTSLPIINPIFSDKYFIFITDSIISYSNNFINPEIIVYDILNKRMMFDGSMDFSNFENIQEYTHYSKQFFTAQIMNSILYFYEYDIKQTISEDVYSNEIIVHALDLQSSETLWSKVIISENASLYPYIFDFKTTNLNDSILLSSIIPTENKIRWLNFSFDGEIIENRDISSKICNFGSCEEGYIISEEESILFEKMEGLKIQFYSKQGVKYIWENNLSLKDASLVDFHISFGKAESISKNLHSFYVKSEFRHNNGTIINVYQRGILIITGSFMKFQTFEISLYSIENAFILSNNEILLYKDDRAILLSFNNIQEYSFPLLFISNISGSFMLLILILMVYVIYQFFKKNYQTPNVSTKE
ncbi:MAG: hypothetical protein GPJ54_11695 [Candidatus Heimdallarchaeota archaeon]|nr:hypothetical protein [Candidatus Heimdallarchaeota archaeon]